ncbi:TVP38/TMEM64 family protein [Bacillus cytotoxicus]|uniref:TVP38/TMEM64 family membrane protein n=2 Tax=Bacillus cytotoxicus TaxID=580165 RepID=A0AAX2CDJ9_9BACI|nr:MULTISPECIES: TVP38/TMEM64 family protein [Bacillus cereus group]ABS21192.1 SNARE associated Golgi protein [Bacillus cytotoxicus NVH 391-98]AWC27839.1 TVP38/TMEM64 family protein [Bacillus cytotoxicus]AWC31885.1 TVP38/TMEM64 family protein [Bacillus cytotoxicus]AWC35922.1 TVP38/TMEM64 family protein [Bacillus cytotoxicus]AWC40780.1 TVP38/TMEM64 family protein [Bacillus cytotoxicus]
MDFQTIKEYFSTENMDQLVESYRAFGLLLGIGLPMAEALIPVLPLIVFVMANAVAFGLWLGCFYSWIGSVLGAFLVFLVIRKFGRSRFFSFINKHPKVRSAMGWIERKGFAPIFVLYCFPFTPSALINVVAGLSRISVRQFGLALTLGKLVMIFMLSYIGHDLTSFIHNPVKTIIVIGVVFILWYVGKKIEVKLELH